MKGIESNKHAWSQTSVDHYDVFKKALLEGKHCFNKYINQEIGNLLRLRCIASLEW